MKLCEKIMNFKEWFNLQTKIGYPCFMDYLSAQKSWEACKNEVLNILQKHTIEHNGAHGTGHEKLDIDCIEKIKNL